MKEIALALLIALAISSEADARGGGGHSGGFHFSSRGSTNGSVHYTDSYYRRDGTFVQGYHATDPNGTRNDNFSTQGNVNPYTGLPGTLPPDGQ